MDKARPTGSPPSHAKILARTYFTPVTLRLLALPFVRCIWPSHGNTRSGHYLLISGRAGGMRHPVRRRAATKASLRRSLQKRLPRGGRAGRSIWLGTLSARLTRGRVTARLGAHRTGRSRFRARAITVSGNGGGTAIRTGGGTRLRHTALTPTFAARMPRGDQTEIRHELARVGKAGDVAQFRDHGRGSYQGHSAKRPRRSRVQGICSNGQKYFVSEGGLGHS